MAGRPCIQTDYTAIIVVTAIWRHVNGAAIIDQPNENEQCRPSWFGVN
jgi:hypothetical protein